MAAEERGPARAARPRIFIDRGGTFTDCILEDAASGALSVVKVLSSDRAPLEGIRKLLGLDENEPIPPCDVRLGTTIATNALLERQGTPCVLVITRGFADLLAIGTQARDDLFALEIRRPAPLTSAVIEVTARRGADGTLLAEPDLLELERALGPCRQSGISSAAIAVLHDYADGGLERAIGDVARKVGFTHLGLSHELCPELGFLSRTETAVLDAYLTPRLAQYLDALARELPGSRLLVMQSSGRLAEPERCRGPHTILSGPAGGVIACAELSRNTEFGALIGFDMGGTSTDVCRVEQSPELRHEQQLGGVHVRAPMLEVHTIAAGGGSICAFDGRRFSVGPESAGARPGPLCYGRAEATEPTLTDVNLVLGRLLPERFPFPLDRERARRALDELGQRVPAPEGPLTAEQAAEGFFAIAGQSMADAIAEVSVKRGYDVREHTLLVYGGAGGQHACSLVTRLGLRAALFHPLAAVLSAYGIGRAALGWNGSRELGAVPLDEAALAALEPHFRELEARGQAALERDGGENVRCHRRVELGYVGTEPHALLALGDAATLTSSFHARHEAEFGYWRPEHTLELRRIRVEVVAEAQRSPTDASNEVASAPVVPVEFTRLFVAGAWLPRVPVYERAGLRAGALLEGPALIVDATDTLVLDPGFRLRGLQGGLLLAEPLARESRPAPRSSSAKVRANPIELELFAHRFMSIAERMGHTLRRSAASVNIRERLDYSCALFDRQGNLIANAPHIPVHLGAMSESVRHVLQLHPEMQPGDAYITNDPAGGGSHLPDVTLVAPVHDDAQLVGFVGARGHHADIGGVTPGSMPAFSTHLGEEGVVFRGERVVRDGRLDRDFLLARLASPPYPARNPQQNLDDFAAALAALRTGSTLLVDAVREFGRERLLAYMGFVQDHAAELVERAVAELGPEPRRFADALDDGTPIVVTLSPSAEGLLVDFSGTGAEVAGNLNAPRAVTMAALIYVLRALVNRPIPLNGGFLRKVRVSIPERSVLAPGPNAAVAGGNVETSQRVVDVLLGAAGLAAASQGTMNNLSFGATGFGYYETIAGGAGAGPTFPGASAVHTHMTNTRITDAELLESRYPVRVLEMSIRSGSGGSGRFRGGDGIRRSLEFLEPAEVSLLTERRQRVPFGLAGGGAAQPGRNSLNGAEIPAKVQFSARPGDVLTIETPGGGGYGAPSTDRAR